MRFCLATILLLASESTARACGVCADQSIGILLPFAPILPLLCLGWFLVMAFVVGDWPTEAVQSSRICPSGKLMTRIAAVSATGFALLWFFSEGSVVWSAFLMSWLVVIYVLRKTIVFAVKSLRTLRTDPLSKICFTVNIVFLAIVVASIPAAHAYARSTGVLTSHLHDHVAEKKRIVVPALIEKGQAAVGPLIGAMRDWLEHNGAYGKNQAVTSAAYCLGQIGGEQAAGVLGEVVNAQIDLAADEDLEWQRSVCLAYAACGGEKAAANLIALYNRTTDENAVKNRWLVLTALTTTCRPEGLQFVFDHMSELLDNGDGRLARMTVAALLEANGPETLKALPTRIFMDKLLTDVEQATAEKSQQIWAESGGAIRQKWMEILKATP